MKNVLTKQRSVARIVPSMQTLEGGGVLIHRAFPIPAIGEIDPFLLLDHMGPLEMAPGEQTGFPEHPHRGFETVTYLLEGEMEHKDSFGHRGLLSPGDVQWMTAGSGLVHSEMPSAGFIQKGGRLEGFQLWVNLPQRDKMMEPRYQELASASIPVGQNEDGSVRVRVIAGEAFGKEARIETRIPIFYLHYTLQPGASVEVAAPVELNAFAYIIKGESQFAKERQLAVFAKDGDSIALENPSSSQPLDALVIGGRPLGEPVARYGPFVMNTKAELAQAFEDYRLGRMGRIR